MCHWPLKGSRKAKKSERGANGRGPLPRRRLFFRRFFRGGDASKKARRSESQRRKIGRPRPHWRSGSVLTPPLEEQPGKTELYLSLSPSSSFRASLPLSSLTFSFSLASTPLSSPLPLRRPPAASPYLRGQPSFPRFLLFPFLSFSLSFFLPSLFPPPTPSRLSPSPRSSAFLLPSFSPFLHPFSAPPLCLSFLSLPPPLHVSFPPFPSCSTPVLLLLYDDHVRTYVPRIMR